MDYFVPVLANNQREPLPLQFIGYKYNFLWPLSETASWLQYILKNFALVISLLCYACTVVAEFTFLAQNAGDISAMTDCMSTSFMGVQYIIRISILAQRHNKMRALFQRFYKEIYFTPDDDPEFCKEIKVISRFLDLCTKVYFTPMLLILVMYGKDILTHDMASTDKPYIYRMSFFYDAQQPGLYILTAFYTAWLTVSTVGLMSAEDLVLCLILCHTSYRYKELQKELGNILTSTQQQMKSGKIHSSEDMHNLFRNKLNGVFKRQQKLNCFVQEAKAHFTYQIFCCLFFGVFLLCVVMFQFQTITMGVDFVKYVVWIISQGSQFIMIGYFGQMLMDESEAMHNSYYMSQWEKLLPHGSVHANALLLNDIKFAILNTQKPIFFDGLKLLPLSHSVVGSSFRLSVSYFMFLNTMNESNKSK